MANERHVSFELLDTQKFVKINELKQITNPIFFIRDGIPTPDGLLSNEIFGISKDDRSNIFAYIDLNNEYFMNPLVYKIWSRMDSRIREIAHGTKRFIIDDNGDFIENDKGGTGIAFIKKNIDNIKIRSTESTKRDRNIQLIEENKKNNTLFCKSFPVIPAFYRDVNTNAGKIGVGEINTLYNSLILAVRSLKDTADYGLTMSYATKGRIQEIMLQIYDWFVDEPNIAKKKGILRRANLSKTTTYGSRVVLSAPNLKVNTVNDLMVTLDKSAVPLASVLTNFFPFIIFYLRRFFENEFSGVTKLRTIDSKSGKEIEITLKNISSEFSDARIKKEIDRFIKGFSNRFIPILIPNHENKEVYAIFKGIIDNRKFTNKIGDGNLDKKSTDILQRRLTWCDLFYQAAVEVTRDRAILITRFPMDSSQNQFPSKIEVSSTKKTMPMIINDKHYPFYPMIREEDIGSNTSNKFIDTLQICNLHLKSIGGDYRP